jgi:hypothetical protein
MYDTGLDLLEVPVYYTGMNPPPICFRVDPETKVRIESAARARGQSVTTFLKEAVINAVEKAEKNPPQRPRRLRDVQDFCLALCWEAQHGGRSGYYRAGRSVFGKVAASDASCLRQTDWQRRVQELIALAQARDHDGVWAWFRRELPRCMEWVPARRRELFLNGVLDECEGNPPAETGC